MKALLFDLKGVEATCRDVIALRNINLQIAEGEKIALVGPSGAGKTTLLNKLYQQRPSECAFIQQHFPLLSQKSVFCNIYRARGHRYSAILNFVNLMAHRKKIIREIQHILKSFGIEEKLFETAGRLSENEQQKVAVSRAIYQDRRILLADEPTATAKPHQADTILKNIMETDRTVVVALHPIAGTLKYAHRIVGLYNGQVRFDLPANRVTSDQITGLYLS